MSKNNCVAKYQLAWKFSGTRESKSQLIPKLSPTIKLNNWDFYIELIFKTLHTGTSASFRIRNPHTIGPILTTTFYLLNEATDRHYKLKNLSPFLTDWFDLGNEQNKMEFLLVVGLEIVNAHTKSEYWLEGKTEALNNIQMCHTSGYYSALLNEKQLRLNIISDTNKSKTILMDGLEQDESVLLDVEVKVGDYNRNLQMTVRSYESKYEILDKEEINSFVLLSKYKNFIKMDSARIIEIATIILNIEMQLSNERINKWKVLIAQQKQNPAKIGCTSTIRPFICRFPPPVAATSCPNEQVTTVSCSLSSTPPAAFEVCVTAEQLKLMYKCFVDNKFCDIMIQFPDGHEIKAHKNVLFSGSTVWRELLDNDDKLSVIPVAGLERETIQSLVTYIYIGYVPKPPKQTDQLLIAAETYGVDGLKTWCEQHLIDKITMDSAVNLLVLAHRYNAKTLFDHVLTFVRKHTADLKIRDEWKSAFFSYPELAFELFNILLN